MIRTIWTLTEKIDRNVLRIVVISLTVGFLLLTGLLVLLKEPAPRQDVYTVTRQDMDVTITESGEIRALNNYDIRLPGSERDRRRHWRGSSTERARILYLIPEGTRAEKGDTLVMMDTSGLITERDQLTEQLITARQVYEDELLNQQALERQDDRALKDIEFTLETRRLERELSQFGSSNEREQKELQLQMAILDSLKLITKMEADRVVRKFRLSKLQQNVDDIRDKIQGINEKIASYTIVADFPAIVVYADNRFLGKIKVGDTPYPGQLLLQLPDLSTITAVMEINDLDRSKVWIGQEGRVTLEAYPNVTFHGVVTEFSPISRNSQTEMASNVKVFETHMELDDTHERLKPGMTATVDLVVDRVKDALVIPLSSILEINGKLFVYRVSGKKTELQEVELGRRNHVSAEVKSGLQEGDTILRNRPLYAGYRPGQYRQWEQEQSVAALLDSQFQSFGELGVLYDYEDARGRVAEAEGVGSAGGQNETSGAVVERVLERMGLEDTAENRKQVEETIERRRSGRRTGSMRGVLPDSANRRRPRMQK